VSSTRIWWGAGESKMEGRSGEGTMRVPCDIFMNHGSVEYLVE
jgi:hypothetical protein